MHPNEEKIYYALLIAASILAVILLLFVISLMSQYRKNKQLYKEKLIAEITASEKERKKLASDIHDDIGPFYQQRNCR
jgi:signal transduction histidine kinase